MNPSKKKRLSGAGWLLSWPPHIENNHPKLVTQTFYLKTKQNTITTILYLYKTYIPTSLSFHFLVWTEPTKEHIDSMLFVLLWLKKELYTIIIVDVHASPTTFFLMITGQEEKRNPSSSLLRKQLKLWKVT